MSPPEGGNVRELPEEVRRGVELFNAGEFFEAHEVIEELWVRTEKGPLKLFYQGLIQAAVAMSHHARGRVGPALTMISRARPKLIDFSPTWCGLDVAGLLRSLDRCEELFLDPCAGEFDYPKIDVS
jgi:hypothetical protein